MNISFISPRRLAILFLLNSGFLFPDTTINYEVQHSFVGHPIDTSAPTSNKSDRNRLLDWIVRNFGDSISAYFSKNKNSVMDNGSEFVEKLSADFGKAISNELSKDETKELFASTIKDGIQAAAEGFEENQEAISETTKAVFENVLEEMTSIVAEKIGSIIKEKEPIIREKIDSFKEEFNETVEEAAARVTAVIVEKAISKFQEKKETLKEVFTDITSEVTERTFESVSNKGFRIGFSGIISSFLHFIEFFIDCISQAIDSLFEKIPASS